MKELSYFKHPIFLVFLITILIQVIVTYLFTKTKRFSIRALVRNLSISFALYFAITTNNYFLLLIPVGLEIIIEFLNIHGYNMEPYIATEYQYSDYWKERTAINPEISNFSEANFDGIMGFNTKDNSAENNKKMHDWAKYAYLTSINNPTEPLKDMDGNPLPEPKVLKKIVDDRKFDLIASSCKIRPGMRILEIGFGEGDFMDYIFKHYGIRPIGVSIANEQVKAVQARGFEAHHMNSWKMTPDVLGTFDVILQCGNLEYIMLSGQNPKEIYIKYSNIIKNLLKPNGKYFITACHVNDKYNHGSRNWIDYSLDYYNHIYFLWAGNDGNYPYGKDGFAKYANEVGLKTIYQEERTHDYLLNMTILFSYIQTYMDNRVTFFSIPSMMDALFKTIAGPYYIHTYMCYLSTSNFVWNPFLWEFVPEDNNGLWEPPVTLQYIMFQK